MLTPVNIEDFGGLDLRSDPEESGCVDLLNVDFRNDGRIGSRTGSAKLTTAVAASVYIQLFMYQSASGTNDRLLAARSGAWDAIDTSGAVVATVVRTAFTSATMLGVPSATYAYIASGTGTVRRFDGSTFATPTATVDGVAGRAMPIVNYLAATPWDNRLVCAYGSATGGPNGTASSASHVHFSGAGTPEVYGSNDYVQLSPGDGESIHAVCAWRDLLFVFKATKFFVFYGTSTSSTGTPVFNYRTINAGVGVDAINQAVAAPDGVYFRGARGIYRTTGGEPTLVSGAIDPLFSGGTAPAFFLGTSTDWRVSSQIPGALAYSDGRIFVGAPGEFLVYDIATQRWSYWTIANASGAYAYGVSRDRISGFSTGLYFPYTNTADIGRTSASVTTDNAAAFASRYRSGFSDLGSPGVEKTVRETELTGLGAPLFAWSRDFGALDTASAVTLGTSPATARGRHRVAKRGSVLSWQASATSGAWRLNRVVPFLRDVRDAGSKTS